MNAYGIEMTEFLLKYVRAKPGMYLTSPKLLYLHIFLTGYSIACWQNLPEREDRFFNHFQDWFFQRIKARKGNVWYAEILEEVQHSEEKALHRFWEYLEEFDRETGGKATS